MTFFLISTLIMLSVVVAVEGVAVLALMRQVGTVLMHVAPPRPGSFAGGPALGEFAPASASAALRPNAPGVFIFLGANCPGCAPIERVLETFARHYNELSVVPIVVGEFEKQRVEHASQLAVPARHDLQELVDVWSVPGTPFAVGVDADGRLVQAGVINSLDQLESLAETTLLGLQEGDLENPPRPADTGIAEDGDEENVGAVVPDRHQERSLV